MLYGKNIGLQNEIIEKYFTNKFDGTINRYEENEFIAGFDTIFSEILNKSLFESKKIILISRATDKIVKFVSQIFEKEIKEKIDLLVVGVSSKGIDWIGDEISKFYNKNTNILLLTKGLTIIEKKQDF